jgi:tetratricopeptide (TPR) repeat protein
MRKCTAIAGIFLASCVIFCSYAPAAAAQDAPQDKPQYTIPEYNAFQAARAEKDPQARVKLLDDFVAKFPNSTLLSYIYQLYYSTYNDLKNYQKTIDYCDKLLALGDKIDSGSRLQALYTRTLAFNYVANEKAPEDVLKKERAAADEGLKILGALAKPANPPMTDAQFAEQKKGPTVLFNYTAGLAAYGQKDFSAAVNYLKAAMALSPTDGATAYRLGLSYLALNPPQWLDGFWALGRAIDMKVSGADQIKTYLRKQMSNYEQPNCDSLVDAQLDELLQLAANAPDRPDTWSIPAAADLAKIAQASTIVTVLADLKGGGDKAKMTWLAICGAEFPEVGGKVIDAPSGTDPVILHLYFGTTQEELEKATTPNMEVKVIGQPEAARLQKDDGARFAGTLVGYNPDPAFMLHWDKAKVNPEDIPAEKGKHTPHKVAPKPGH